MSQPGNTPIVIRPVRASDQAYIASTLWRSILGNNRAPSRRRRLNEQIDRVLDDKTTRALVASDPVDSDRILGYLVFAAAPHMRVVHYAYVRDEERGRGIARRLVSAAWPGSDARFVFTLRGPKTASFLADHKNATIIPLEEFLR